MRKNNFFHAAAAAFFICAAAAFSMTAAAADSRWDNSTYLDDDGNICIEFSEIEVVLPYEWNGKVQINISSDSASFYHIASREAYTAELGYANGGHLFTICYSEDDDYEEIPDYMLIGKTGEGAYYAWFPTDYQGYMSNIDIFNEYNSLFNDLEWVKANITLTTEVITTVDSEYIFPQSSTEYLSEEDLYGMTADEVQMAINEIYARHHRRFLLEDVQAYFDSRSWYSGTIEADDFDVNVMNKYETANISLMVDWKNDHGDDSEYIIPASSSRYLTEKDLTGMSADRIQMAINEIYARHHRRFLLEDVQAYFDSKSWYTGTVNPSDFDVNVLNKYETANIDLMVSRINALS